MKAGRTRINHVSETVGLLAARSPKLPTALRDAAAAGHAYLVLDGTLIPIDRVAADRPFYSGKHRRHGINLQVIATPRGDIAWVSGPLPAAVHDLAAARIWGILRYLAASGLIILADKGYRGAGDPVITPYKGRDKPESQKTANRATPTYAALANAPTPGSKPGGSCANSVAARGPASSPGPSTSLKPAKSEDENTQCSSEPPETPGRSSEQCGLAAAPDDHERSGMVVVGTGPDSIRQVLRRPMLRELPAVPLRLPIISDDEDHHET